MRGPSHPRTRHRRAIARFGPAFALALGILIGFPAASRSGAAEPIPAEDGFRPLFDGRTLEGWGSPEMHWWTVEEGAITGRITRERPCSTNQYLVWQGGALGDFELKLRSRLSGEGGINNGFQFRSRVLPDGDVAGYQMDNNLGTDWLVRLYDEFGRHTLAWRGKQTTLDAEGRASSAELPGAGGPAWFQLGDWHEYHLVCDGPRLTLRVDGRLAAQVEDHDRRRADPAGVFALQLHSGPPTVVQFKDIRLKILRSTPPPPPPGSDADRRRAALLEAAEAYWDFGVGGHMRRHALRYVGSLDDFEFDVRTEGPGARPGARVTLLRKGWFEGPAGLIPAGRPFTLWIRARDPEGAWNGTLLASGDPAAAGGFTFAGTQGTLRLTARTPDGPRSLEFPGSSFEPAAWHDFVIRSDGRGLRLLCDGREVARNDAFGPLETGTQPLLVGSRLQAGRGIEGFRGELEGAALWLDALSARELRRLEGPRAGAAEGR